MSVSKKSISTVLLQLAVALFLIVSGILTVQLDGGLLGKLQAGFSNNEVASAVHKIFNGDLANLIVILLGLCEIIAGVFLFLNFFINTGKITNLFVFIIIIVWCVVIALIDVLGSGGLLDGAFASITAFLSFLKSLSSHLLVLGALLVVWKK